MFQLSEKIVFLKIGLGLFIVRLESSVEDAFDIGRGLLGGWSCGCPRHGNGSGRLSHVETISYNRGYTEARGVLIYFNGKVVVKSLPSRQVFFSHNAIWVNNGFFQQPRFPCPRRRVSLLVSLTLTLASRSAVRIVATGTVKQHDGDPRHWSRRPRAGVDGQTDPARKGTDNDVEMRDRDLETPLFLPSPSSEGTSSEPPIRQRDKDRDHDLLDIISIDSSSSRRRPPRRSPRKAKKQSGQEQLMAYVLVPPLPPGARKSDYMPVQKRSRTRQRQTAVRGKRGQGTMRPRRNSCMLQVAFENNWPGAGSTGPSGQKTKKAAKETVVVADDEDDEDEESDKSKIPTPLDEALAAAFTLDSTNPDVVASASAPAATTTRRSAKETRAEASNGSASVEVVHSVADETRSLCRRVERGNVICTRRPPVHADNDQRRRVVDEQHQDDSDDSEIEIIVDAPSKQRRVPKAQPQSHPPARPQPRRKPRRSTQQHRTSTPPVIHTPISVHMSTPESTPPPQEQSSPITPPDVNSLAGLSLTILPEPARTEIAIPPPRDATVRDPAGFCYEGAAVSAHGLLATSPAAEPSPVSDSGACFIITNSASATNPDPDDLQDASLDLDLDPHVSMDLEAGPADAHGVEDDVVPPPAATAAHRGPRSHKPNARPELDLASPNRGGEGSIDWRAGNVFGGAGASTDTGAGEYAGNGTIDPSVLGGGGNLSPERLGDDPSSPVRGFGGGVQPSGATDEDNEEEEDVMGMLYENTSDDDSMPPSGLGKGKGRAVVVDGVVELSESVAAAAGSRMRRKSWRKELADEAEVGHNDDSDNEGDDDDGPRAHAIPVFTNARRKNRTPASSSSGVLAGGLTFCHHCRSTTRRPKMRCTLIKASTEMRWPQPILRSLHRETRGEAYIPERNGGWRSWIARQGGSHSAAPTPAKKSKSNNLGTTPAATKTTKKPAIMATTTTTDAEVFDGSWSATAVFTVSGEPLGSAFLQTNKARIVPVSQPTASPATATTTPSAPASFTSSPIAEPTQEQQQSQRRQHGFIGKPRKTWGRLVSLPDPDHDQLEQQKKKTKGKGEGEDGGPGTPGRRRRRSASLTPLDDDDDGDEDGNPGEGGDADADADADDGIWPGEYVVSVPSAQTEETATRITPEEVERAIGAAFAIGGSAQSSSSSM
ncbi:hypothetical protein EDB84DRAFT_1437744 [Lactarius hengduanensis]|nr:hypothetical protein EDB84DRAFT_1437744 [Lactarius hengduanensis]